MNLLIGASMPAIDPAHLSPSLRVGRQGAAAYELKFLLNEEQARAVERRVADFLAPDPHADPALGGAYRTTTLYCDTPDFEVYRAAGVGRGRKHRLRRYGLAPVAFLERKTKNGQRVRKRRSTVPLEELPALDAPPADPSWPGAWFAARLARDGLRPVCRVTYDRTAYAGTTGEGPLRVTFDRTLLGRLSDGWDLRPAAEGPDLLGGQVIAEFKFQGALPVAGKRLVEELRLSPGPASKYRRFLRSTGLVSDGSF